MDKKFSLKGLSVLDQQRIKSNLIQYKEHSIYLITIFICIVVFIAIVIPQFLSFFSERGRDRQTQEKIRIIKENLNFFSSLNDERLDEEVQILSLAVPTENDFASILNTVSIIASRAQVSLGDYSFKVGDVSNSPAQKGGKLLSTTIALAIFSDIQGTKLFLRELYKSFPLSEVSSIQASSQRAEITINFYYKPFTTLLFDNERPVRIRSKEDSAMIDTLSFWYSENLNFQPPVVSTQSAQSRQ